jgi:DNA-binding IscR family transcriptional regulator
MCAVHPAWEDAYRALSEALGRTTLQSILDVDRQLESGVRLGVGKQHSEKTARLRATAGRRS